MRKKMCGNMRRLGSCGKVMRMSKTVKRLAWYTGKVVEMGAVHALDRTERHRRRAERLRRYKMAMNERLRETIPR